MPARVPAERLFSWISLGWIRLFGLQDYNSTLRHFLEGRAPFIQSDLFARSAGSVWLPAPRSLPASGSWKKRSRQANKAANAEMLPADLSKNETADKDESENFDEGPAHSDDMELSQTNASVTRTEESDEIPEPESAVLRDSGAIAGKDQLQDSTTLVMAEAYLAAVRAGRPIRRHETSTDQLLRHNRTFTGWLSTSDSRILEKWQACFEFMADEGIGAKRSTGSGVVGSYSISETELSAKIHTGGKRKFSRHVILSSCCPTTEFVEQIEASAQGSNDYSLSFAAGWIYGQDGLATDVRKPLTCAFETGSTFSCKPEGKLVEVGTTEYPSYRYGLPFVLSY